MSRRISLAAGLAALSVVVLVALLIYIDRLASSEPASVASKPAAKAHSCSDCGQSGKMLPPGYAEGMKPPPCSTCGASVKKDLPYALGRRTDSPSKAASAPAKVEAKAPSAPGRHAAAAPKISEGAPLIAGSLGLRGAGSGGGGLFGKGAGSGSVGEAIGIGGLGTRGRGGGSAGVEGSMGRAESRVTISSPSVPTTPTTPRMRPSDGLISSRDVAEGGRGGSVLDAALTAGDWDDTRNFSWFLRYRRNATELAGDPAREIDLSRSAVIEVTNALGEPVRGAQVRVRANGYVILSTTTPADGRVFFVPSLEGLGRLTPSVTLDVSYGDTFSLSERALDGQGAATWAVKLDSAPYRRASALDVAFVVDTTGSMSDELRYLQREIHRIATRVQSSFQPLDLRFALVIYRDEGDRYVVSSTDFGPLERFEKALLAARADGGGDEPEAVDQALAALGQLSWSQGDVAKVAFLVGDAPSHPEGRVRVMRAGNDARIRGIRLYTVAASDTRPWAELQFRALAQLTLGRYVFLTDDSGVGNAHAEPHIPCYQVQKLAGLIERTLRSEVRGWREEVPSDEVIRNVGGPQQGVCSYQGLAYRL